eukprot:gnl/Dysnectes_brevis/6384_a9864_228.p1 GENE.gnl/Dysnectes_brevis/6384_a9864_228~~gnl/Dysnectes_brevis/6384_a9864_228.p1  ORF type:complete len:738 (+),score=188.19 gnl/Dysnectes_brevis/6384_a9864_228:43-2256(+)
MSLGSPFANSFISGLPLEIDSDSSLQQHYQAFHDLFQVSIEDIMQFPQDFPNVFASVDAVPSVPSLCSSIESGWPLPHPDHIKMVETQLIRSRTLRRKQLTLGWLQRQHQPRVCPADGRWLESQPTHGSLMPDAPEGGPSKLAARDREEEGRLLRGVWHAVRAGDLEGACKLCEEAGQEWRAASLRGARLLDLSVGDGNPQVLGWAELARSIGQGDSYPRMERAIYGALGADLASAMLACQPNTPDALWARLTCDVRQQYYRTLEGKAIENKYSLREIWDSCGYLPDLASRGGSLALSASAQPRSFRTAVGRLERQLAVGDLPGLCSLLADLSTADGHWDRSHFPFLPPLLHLSGFTALALLQRPGLSEAWQSLHMAENRKLLVATVQRLATEAIQEMRKLMLGPASSHAREEIRFLSGLATGILPALSQPARGELAAKVAVLLCGAVPLGPSWRGSNHVVESVEACLGLLSRLDCSSSALLCAQEVWNHCELTSKTPGVDASLLALLPFWLHDTEVGSGLPFNMQKLALITLVGRRLFLAGKLTEAYTTLALAEAFRPHLSTTVSADLSAALSEARTLQDAIQLTGDASLEAWTTRVEVALKNSVYDDSFKLAFSRRRASLSRLIGQLAKGALRTTPDVQARLAALESVEDGMSGEVRAEEWRLVESQICPLPVLQLASLLVAGCACGSVEPCEVMLLPSRLSKPHGSNPPLLSHLPPHALHQLLREVTRAGVMGC